MIALMILVPLLTAIGAIAIAPEKLARYLALGAGLFALAFVPFATRAAHLTWFSVGGTDFAVSVSAGPLNVLLAAITLIIGSAAVFYSFGSMDLPSEHKRYYMEAAAIEAATVLLALSGSFVTLFVAWASLSLLGYLAVGFWYGRDRADAAARRIVMMSLIGDGLLLASIAMFEISFGTLDFAAITGSVGMGVSAAQIAAVGLLTMAVLAKSAQFPLHELFPDVAEAPSGMAAMLGSVSSAKAGVFTVMLLLPVFAVFNYTPVLLAIGLLTAVFCTFNAAKEQNVNKIIAYSAIQGAGLMFAALGMGAMTAAVYFFMLQGFYSALMFLVAGIMVRTTGKDSLKDMGGLRENKLLFISTAFGALSIAGFMPFSGFFANVGLSYAFASNFAVYVMIALMGYGTSFYTFRWLFLSSKKTATGKQALNYDIQESSVSYSIAFLALANLLAGPIFFVLPSFLGTSSSVPLAAAAVLAIDVTLAAFAGTFASYNAYVYSKRRKRLQLHGLEEVVQTTRAFNDVYGWAVAFVNEIAEGVGLLESRINEAYDAVGASSSVILRKSGAVISGDYTLYFAIFIACLLIFLVMFVI